MISVLIEAALRSLLVGLSVAVGLRIFRVRNVPAQKAAWGLVLASALAMPLLLPFTAQWHLLPARVKVVLPAYPMTLLEELQARILAKSGSSGTFSPLTASIPQSYPPEMQDSSTPKQEAAPRAGETPSRSARTHHAAKPGQAAAFIPGRSASSSAQPITYGASPMRETQSPAPIQRSIVSANVLALTLYCGIATVLLVRIALGLFAMINLWRTATPIPARLLPHQLPYDAVSLQVRASSKIASPLAVGSGILLPGDYTTWDSEKLRIVLAHERSHIRQGDFYLQLLASLYAAFAWFSPLGWWLKHELAELAEAISDLAGMEEAESRTAYAQILLEFAAASHRVSIGIAMARPGSLSRRIERLLNDDSFRQCFAGGRRTLLAIALVPLALLASTALVGVQAGTQSSSPAAADAPAALASPRLDRPRLASPQLESPQAVPAAAAIQLDDRTLPQLPPVTLTVVPELKVPVPEPAPEMAADISPAPLIRMDPAATRIATMVADGIAGGIADGMQEAGPLSFDRTFAVGGAAQLNVSTGSGNIHLTRGSGNQIHIHGQIRVNHGGSEEQAREIAANPPIERNGDMIRVGQQHEHWRGISIDYQIEAPAGTVLVANSGSGNIVDEGVGQNAKLQTGSGDIHATGLEGPFIVHTGSGNIVAEQSGHGDVIAETGSGDIELKAIHGGFRGQTGSGDIKASGTPSASWTLQTGSGNIELFTGNAPLTLDASTGSGSVSTEHGMMVQGSLDHHHIRGTLNGGGAESRVQTGSGDIHIH
jgi:beta-lactamase regulating signal transducer with metallopeptidase domain